MHFCVDELRVILAALSFAGAGWIWIRAWLAHVFRPAPVEDPLDPGGPDGTR